MNNKCLTFQLKTLEKWQTSAETTKSWIPLAFANASLDFPGEIGNCVSAKTSNLGKVKLFTQRCRSLRFLANHRFA